MIGYRFVVTCPACAGDLEHTASSVGVEHRPVAASGGAVAYCAPCNASWLIRVEIASVKGMANRGARSAA